MRTRDVIILALVLAALVCLYLIVRQPLAPTGRGPGSDVRLLPRFDPEAVTSIVLDGGRVSVTLVRGEEGWTLAGGPRRFVEGPKVDHALGMLAKLTRERLVSIVPDKHAVFEVDRESGDLVALLAGADTLAAVLIGKSGPSGLDSYVRVAGETDVYLSGRGLAANVLRGAEHWRDRVILPFNPNDVTAISIESGGPEIVLERGDRGAWTARRPEEFVADTNAGDRLLLTLVDLRAMDFADDISPGEAGLDVEGAGGPAATVEVRLVTGETRSLWIGARDDDAYYARRPDRETIYLLSPRTVEFILSDPSAYRPADRSPGDPPPPTR